MTGKTPGGPILTLGLWKTAIAGVHSLHSDGLQATGRRARMFIGQRWFGNVPDFTQHRYVLSERIARECDYTVANGPFTGLELSRDSWWSAADRGMMLLGYYEAEVLAQLADLCDGAAWLIDIGAADGYYAVGAVKAGLVPSAVCFEMSAEGRSVIQSNSAMNGVSDEIVVLGLAGRNFLDEIPPEAWSEDRPAVFLFDIEGGEFDLLTEDVLRRLRWSSLIVEIHEPIRAKERRADSLIERASKYFDVQIITTGARDPGACQLLELWSDDDRWLLCSESRTYLMRWMVLTPKRG